MERKMNSNTQLLSNERNNFKDYSSSSVCLRICYKYITYVPNKKFCASSLKGIFPENGRHLFHNLPLRNLSGPIQVLRFMYKNQTH